MRIKKKDVGRQCQVWYDDMGSVTDMIVDVDFDGKSLTVLNFGGRSH